MLCYILALASFKEVLRAVPEAKLEIVGTGPLNALLRKVIKDLQLERAVSLSGKVSDDQLSDLMHNSTLFCHASFSEAYSNTITEAMSAGLPVVCTDITGIYGMVDNGVNGIIVPVGDEHALAEALVRLLTDIELARKMGEQSLIKAKRYSWDTISKQYYEIYRRFEP